MSGAVASANATNATVAGTTADKEDLRARKLRKLNDMQLAPANSLPMMMFMLWMAGNDIHIFSILITGTAVSQPFSLALNVGGTFKVFEDDPSIKGDLWRAKTVYLLCCVVAMVVGLIKLSWMGLMPFAASDWVDHTPPTYVSLATMMD